MLTSRTFLQVKPYWNLSPRCLYQCQWSFSGISHSFATTAFRFPHTLVPPALLLRKRDGHCEFRTDVGGFGALRLCQNWYHLFGTSQLELFFCRWNAQDVTLRHVLRMIFSCTRLDRARIYCRWNSLGNGFSDCWRRGQCGSWGFAR